MVLGAALEKDSSGDVYERAGNDGYQYRNQLGDSMIIPAGNGGDSRRRLE